MYKILLSCVFVCFFCLFCTKSLDESKVESIRISGKIIDESTGLGIDSILVELEKDCSSFLGVACHEVVGTFYSDIDGYYDITIQCESGDDYRIIVKSEYWPCNINSSDTNSIIKERYLGQSFSFGTTDAVIKHNFILYPAALLKFTFKTDKMLLAGDTLWVIYQFCSQDIERYYTIDDYAYLSDFLETECYKVVGGGNQYISWKTKKSNITYGPFIETLFCERFSENNLLITY